MEYLNPTPRRDDPLRLALIHHEEDSFTVHRLRASGSELKSWNLCALAHRNSNSFSKKKSAIEKLKCTYIGLRFPDTATMNYFYTELLTVIASRRRLRREKTIADTTARVVDQQPTMRTAEDRTPSASRRSSLASAASGNDNSSGSRTTPMFGETRANIFTPPRLPEIEPMHSSLDLGIYSKFEGSSSSTKEMR